MAVLRLGINFLLTVGCVGKSSGKRQKMGSTGQQKNKQYVLRIFSKAIKENSLFPGEQIYIGA